MAGMFAGSSTGPHWLMRGSKAAQNEIIVPEFSLECFWSVACSMLIWLLLARKQLVTSLGLTAPEEHRLHLFSWFHLSSPARGWDLSTSHFPSSRGYHQVLGTGGCVVGWDLPRTYASGWYEGYVLEGTAYIPSSAVPIKVKICCIVRTVVLQENHQSMTLDALYLDFFQMKQT